MAKVIHLSDRKPIPPKVVSGEHAGQRYTCRFDPNAPKGEQWVWRVDYKRVYPYFGASPTAEAAAVKARRLIHMMNKHSIESDESE
jgi:hypothetical protein